MSQADTKLRNLQQLEIFDLAPNTISHSPVICDFQNLSGIFTITGKR